MMPSFQEAHISQLPAIRLLQQLGYAYLSPEEVYAERRAKRRAVLLEDVLTRQLRRLNAISFKGVDAEFSEENIAKAVEALREVPFDGLVRTSEKVYDLLTLGKSFDQTVQGETKGFTLRYIDWENPRNNVFHVTAEYEVERTASRETRRPDIVCFVNGIPSRGDRVQTARGEALARTGGAPEYPQLAERRDSAALPLRAARAGAEQERGALRHGRLAPEVLGAVARDARRGRRGAVRD
jgi:hypothetical protein